MLRAAPSAVSPLRHRRVSQSSGSQRHCRNTCPALTRSRAKTIQENHLDEEWNPAGAGNPAGIKSLITDFELAVLLPIPGRFALAQFPSKHFLYEPLLSTFNFRLLTSPGHSPSAFHSS